MIQLMLVILAFLVVLTSGCAPPAQGGGPPDPRSIDVECLESEPCYQEALALMNDQESIPLAVAHLVRACESSHGDACLEAGLQYWFGGFIPKDLHFARVLFERACDLGNGQGCNKAGTMYELGWGVPRDMGQAARWYTRGCDLGDRESCFDLGP